MDRVDLHTHSGVSDGTDAPSDIVRFACDAKIQGVALTDHDTLDGLDEFMSVETPSDIVRIPGLEISTNYNGREAHLLGYFVPRDDSRLDSKLQWMRNVRETRFPKFLKKMEDIGIFVEKEEIERLLKGVACLGRPHIARILVNHGIVQDITEAFDKYLKKGRPLYITKERLAIKDAISLLHLVGAVPVLAHPLSIHAPSIQDVLCELKKEGLLGVEVAYDYSDLQIIEETSVVRNAAESLGLIGTGGTDYHGRGWRVPIGSVFVSSDVVTELLMACKELGGDIYSWEQ